MVLGPEKPVFAGPLPVGPHIRGISGGEERISRLEGAN